MLLFLERIIKLVELVTTEIIFNDEFGNNQMIVVLVYFSILRWRLLHLRYLISRTCILYEIVPPCVSRRNMFTRKSFFKVQFPETRLIIERFGLSVKKITSVH